MKNVLITGIYGSCATYLAEFLLKNSNLNVQGIARWHTDRKQVPSFFENIKVFEADLLDLSNLIRVFEEAKPDYIFHLAAVANVQLGFKSPNAVLNNNINGTLNLLEAIRVLRLNPVIQFCGTSEVYGQVSKEDIPIKENQKIDPVNVYAISKLTQEKLVKSYYLSYGIKSIITRTFGYINPRRPDIFSSAFAKQIVEIEEGKRDMLLHGNLNSVRTLLDVRDVCRAYWLAAEKCQIGEEYNIGSEVPITVNEFLEKLKMHSKKTIISKVSEQLLRPVDVTLQIPSIEKFKACTSFTPEYTLDQSVEFLLDHYRNKY